ncbi:SDH family Clp fold serine proteinase [Nitrosomonas eutropha]|nr:SppA protein [Nitrosomonas eutropha]PXV82470.1 serine dehydrogenase proteinase [Nitrosomonas eutropha]
MMITKEVLDKYEGDVVLYYGGINREGYKKISNVLESIPHEKIKICLVLVTYGGDPDAAYRIARALNHHFEKVEILIPDACKSAGTLVCIGAHKLIFGDRGELGPLDIQLSKPDEIFENMSGLNIIQAINALENQILVSFRNYLMDIRGGSGLTTKLAADIATKLADGFIAPIAAKIDPVTLGEHQRAVQIAFDYGRRLNKVTNSLASDSLIRLVSGYPSHGFVIDRKEASTLFKSVEKPDATTIELYKWALGLLPNVPYSENPIVCNFLEILEKEAEPIAEGANETETINESGIKTGSEGIDESSKYEGKSDKQNDSCSSQ